MVMARSATPSIAAIRADDVDEVGAQRGLAAGEAELAEAHRHRGPRDGLDLGGAQQLAGRDEAQPAQRHAVDAAQVAVVDQRERGSRSHGRTGRAAGGPPDSSLPRAARAVSGGGTPRNTGTRRRAAALDAGRHPCETCLMQVRVRLFASLREAVGRERSACSSARCHDRGRLARALAAASAARGDGRAWRFGEPQLRAVRHAAPGGRRGRLHPTRERRLSLVLEQPIADAAHGLQQLRTGARPPRGSGAGASRSCRRRASRCRG